MRIVRYLACERHQLVGGLPHRRDRHNQVGRALQGNLDPVGDRQDLFGCRYRAAAVLLHNDGNRRHGQQVSEDSMACYDWTTGVLPVSSMKASNSFSARPSCAGAFTRAFITSAVL